MKKQYSAVSLFSGCGGSDIGLLHAGIEPVYANEKCASACQLYEEIVAPGVIRKGDVQYIRQFPKADILAGCYPCQGYSQAGRRNGEDEINYLYREFDRALRSIKPLAFIVENVDGMRFSQNQHLLNNQLIRFRMAGYRVSWNILNARDYGLAQERRRLFIVGIRSSENIIYTFPEPSCGNNKNQQRYKTLRDVIWKYRQAPEGSYCDEPIHWYYMSRNRRKSWDEQAPTIVAHWRHVPLHPDSPPLRKVGKDQWDFAEPGYARRLSYIECAAIQGFPAPEAFRSGSVRERFKAIGNAVPPPLFSAVAKKLVALLQKSA